jgi:short-subunit dehydrogenase
MGRAVARRLAERGDSLALLGRDMSELERSARDLEVRGTGAISTVHCDLEQTETFEAAIEEACRKLGGMDAVVVTAGQFATQEELEQDPALAVRVATVNFTNTIAFCEAARRRLLESGGGTLCVFSSVAGERGRKPVIIYGASNLDHKYWSHGLRVVTVKPGFVKTRMTDRLPPPPFAGEPEEVAKRVVEAIDRGKPIVYVPGAWRYVMAIIRHLPRAVMRRVRF